MTKEEIALELIKLTYRHDQKPEDLITKSQALYNWIINVSETDIDMKKKKTIIK